MQPLFFPSSSPHSSSLQETANSPAALPVQPLRLIHMSDALTSHSPRPLRWNLSSFLSFRSRLSSLREGTVVHFKVKYSLNHSWGMTKMCTLILYNGRINTSLSSIGSSLLYLSRCLVNVPILISQVSKECACTKDGAEQSYKESVSLMMWSASQLWTAHCCLSRRVGEKLLSLVCTSVI